MATLNVLAFDPDGRPVEFTTWLDDLQLFLLTNAKDSVSLFDYVSGNAVAPANTEPALDRSQWQTRDAAARLAICNHLPITERAHFSQHKTAKALYDAVVARYSSPATADLGRLMLPYLFPDLSSFTTAKDLISHLRASDTRLRATLPDEFLAENHPPMYFTLYFLITRLPDTLRSVRDHFLTLDPYSLTVDDLEKHLLAVEKNILALLLTTSLVLRRSQLLPLRVGSAAASREARVAGVADVAVEGAVVEVAGAVEVVAVVVRGGGSGGGGGGAGSGGGGSGGGGGGGSGGGGGGAGLGIAPAALGACESAPPSTAFAQALHTFTLDSGASRCFFRDSTTVTPLLAPVPVSLADPSGGPVLARSSTVLLCPAVPSGELPGLHLPSFSTNLVSNAVLQDQWVDTCTPGGQRVAICTCSRTGRHLATFTRAPGSSLYTLTTASRSTPLSPQLYASAKVATRCECRRLSHDTLLWHHRPGPPSLPRLRNMHSRFLVSSLPRSLPALPPSHAPPCIPCVEGRQRAAPQSSSFPPTEAPLQTLHLDVWGPARVRGQGDERYFLLVVDDYTRYTTVFCLQCKGEVPNVLIPWIRAVLPS
ncbi:unnamed protein product [Closterium sp. NIES-64]|nr:unnamed protein product [Closterium sp. NIES-64]